MIQYRLLFIKTTHYLPLADIRTNGDLWSENAEREISPLGTPRAYFLLAAVWALIIIAHREQPGNTNVRAGCGAYAPTVYGEVSPS